MANRRKQTCPSRPSPSICSQCSADTARRQALMTTAATLLLAVLQELCRVWLRAHGG